MSIVGTRPPLISETNLYEPRHKVRLAIKPGITGMWQVSGRSDITDFEEVVRLDKEYIENWDIGLDIKILLKTVMVVAKKDGSMTDSEYTRIKKMKNLIETLNRPEEHMTIYRTDGSFVSLKYENSQVTICDSREKNVRRVVEADNFIRDIMRE